MTRESGSFFNDLPHLTLKLTTSVNTRLARYVDRLNDGERVREDQVLAENPEYGPLLVEYLADYMGVVTEDDVDQLRKAKIFQRARWQPFTAPPPPEH